MDCNGSGYGRCRKSLESCILKLFWMYWKTVVITAVVVFVTTAIVSPFVVTVQGKVAKNIVEEGNGKIILIWELERKNAQLVAELEDLQRRFNNSQKVLDQLRKSSIFIPGGNEDGW